MKERELFVVPKNKWGQKCCPVIRVHEKRKSTYLSDINKPAHQILVGEGIDGILRLLACSVLHNSMGSLVNEFKRKRKRFYPPASLQRHELANPFRHP
jgi:hypothetical protein